MLFCPERCLEIMCTQYETAKLKATASLQLLKIMKTTRFFCKTRAALLKRVMEIWQPK